MDTPDWVRSILAQCDGWTFHPETVKAMGQKSSARLAEVVSLSRSGSTPSQLADLYKKWIVRLASLEPPDSPSHDSGGMPSWDRHAEEEDYYRSIEEVEDLLREFVANHSVRVEMVECLLSFITPEQFSLVEKTQMEWDAPLCFFPAAVSCAELLVVYRQFSDSAQVDRLSELVFQFREDLGLVHYPGADPSQVFTIDEIGQFVIHQVPMEWILSHREAKKVTP